MLLTKKLRLWLFIGLLVGAPLSKYPSLSNPAYNFTSFRFGLYQVLAVLFVLACAWPTIKKLKDLYTQNKIVFISGIVLLAIIIAGVMFAIDKQRGWLMGVSFISLLVLVATAWWYVRFEIPKNRLKLIARLFLSAGIVYGLLAIAEFFVLTLTSASSGIVCNGCYSGIFGFPRINLLAAEPLFLANAMLPFFFVSLGWFYKNKSKLALYCLILSAIAISLTFSRGAYVAIAVGLVFYVVLLASAKMAAFRGITMVVAIIFAAFALGWLLLIWSASYKYASTPNIAYNTASTMLDHMSLGKIKLPPKVVPQPATPANVFVSPGLIQASTQERTGAAELALNSWSSNFKTAAVGVGAGNLGPFTNKYVAPSAPSNLTVYIYYILLLAETGAIGLAAFGLIYIGGLAQFIKRYFKDNNWCIYAAVGSLIIAFLVQYWFFGTFINTLYIWLWSGIILGLSGASWPKRRYNSKKGSYLDEK